jgi:hypothetical protein
MTQNDNRVVAAVPASPAGQGSRRRPYHAPRLQVYGNLCGLTLGGSPGASDSGQNNMHPFFFAEDYYDLP